MDGWRGAAGLLNHACGVCGLVFLREAGYFLGAMYISYGLGVLTVLPLTVGLTLFSGWPLPVVLCIMVAQTLLSAPLFLRISRLLWLHVDQALDPR